MAILSIQTSNGYKYVEILPSGFQYGPNYPLVIFLCGQDGKRSPEYLLAKEIPAELQAWADAFNLIVLAPYTDLQFTKAYIETMLDVGARLGCGERKIITGLSFGGGAVWSLLSASADLCNRFTAAIVICGIAGVTGCAIAESNLPVLAFHAKDDTVVSIGYSTNAINRINACLPKIAPVFIELPQGNHWIWGKVYHHINQYFIEGKQQSVVQWALSKVKSIEQVPAPVPVFSVKAPENMTTKFPGFKMEAQVSGEDWHREKARWTVLEVPSGVNRYTPMIISGGGWIHCQVELPKPGRYVFEISLTSVSGQTAKDLVTVLYEVAKPVLTVAEDNSKRYILYQDHTWEEILF